MKVEGVKLRCAVMSDAANIIKLIMENYKFQVERCVVEQTVVRNIDNCLVGEPFFLFKVAVLGGDVVGYGISRYSKLKSTIEMEIVCGMRFQNLGVGSALMQIMLTEVEKNKVDVLAKVVAGNISCVTMLERFNFLLDNECDGFLVYRRMSAP